MKLNFKHRYLLTRAGNIRGRYVALVALAVFLSGLWLFTGDEDYVAPATQIATVVEDATETPKMMVDRVINWGDYDPEVSGQGIAPFKTRMGMRPYFNKPHNFTSTIEVESGDVLGTLMEETGLKDDNYRAAMTAIKKHVDPSDIRPGHKITVTFEKYKDQTEIKNIDYIFDGLKSVRLTPDNDGWKAEAVEKALEIQTRAGKTKVENSLYGSMGKAGIPDGIINRMIKAYSWTVDFQRDIWGGEDIEVLYETKESADGEVVRSHRLLYASLKVRGRNMPIYIYEKDKGFPKYFEPSGQSIRRALMKTPIDGARISSGFGMRTHPVLGYRKAHRGLDFAAPTGTPIYAAGDGIVERANRFGAYGNYIRVRHNDTYKTAYAHLSKFAKGMTKGTRVKQGQVIGYVGSTGRSTGPHLHYEVIKNGEKVNPHSVDLPLGEQLRGAQLSEFQRVIAARNRLFESLTGFMPGMNDDMVKPTRKPL